MQNLGGLFAYWDHRDAQAKMAPVCWTGLAEAFSWHQAFDGGGGGCSRASVLHDRARAVVVIQLQESSHLKQLQSKRWIYLLHANHVFDEI